MSDSIATQAPFDLRYLYISGGVFDGNQPCQSCATGCTAGGQSCASSNPNGCGWWGCWQYDQNPPGQYMRDFVSKAKANGEIPMVTYYQVLQASGASEGSGEVKATDDQAFMTRYFADFRFLLQQIGQNVVLVHIEPDFWGYAEQMNSDPHKIPAAVASANPTDCSNQENSIAGMGKCMISMVRKYAPKAKVGLHASGWGTNIDVLQNKNAGLNVKSEADKLGTFLTACGEDKADFVVVETSDRDAGYYQSIGQNRWWDATNKTLPDFAQAIGWAKDVAEKVGKPLIWWQIPVGNMSEPNTNQHWKDNRVAYFFSHTSQLAAAHSVGMAFGAGASTQTTPSTDGGNLVSKVKAYEQGGGQSLCSP